MVYLQIFNQNIGILGGENIGSGITKGVILSSMIKPEKILLTHRKNTLLNSF